MQSGISGAGSDCPGTLAEEHGALPRIGLAIYGCELDEAALFRAIAPGLGVIPTLTEAPVSDANTELARGKRCISVGHKTEIPGSTLVALRQAGVLYISTRSVGYDHIDVHCAENLGISVENVNYSPDSVADYTLMLMLMAVRNAKSTIVRAQVHDYRLNDARERTPGPDRWSHRNGTNRLSGDGQVEGIWLPSAGP